MACYSSGSCWLIAICIVQLITIAARQTFDFLGLQWTAIAANFCQIIFVVIGLCGTYKNKPRLLAVYSTWILIWMAWNTYIIFLYLGVGQLKLEDHLMTLNLDMSPSFTWFKTNAYDCATSNYVETTPDPASSYAPCILDYRYIEVFQSALQVLLSVFGFSIACYVIGILREEEEDQFDFIGGLNGNSSRKQKHDPNDNSLPHRQPLVGATFNSSSSA